MEKIYAQQGDLILNETNKVPTSAKKITLDNKVLTLLRGEGVNTHDLMVDELSDVEVFQDGETLYLKTRKKVNLVHQEHGTQTLEPNKIYKRIIEREFDYNEMEARNVRD